MMGQNPRDTSEEDKKLIQEYLDKGGKITQFKFGERSEEIEFKGGFYTKRKKKKEDQEANDQMV